MLSFLKIIMPALYDPFYYISVLFDEEKSSKYFWVIPLLSQPNSVMEGVKHLQGLIFKINITPSSFLVND